MKMTIHFHKILSFFDLFSLYIHHSFIGRAKVGMGGSLTFSKRPPIASFSDAARALMQLGVSRSPPGLFRHSASLASRAALFCGAVYQSTVLVSPARVREAEDKINAPDNNTDKPNLFMLPSKLLFPPLPGRQRARVTP